VIFERDSTILVDVIHYKFEGIDEFNVIISKSVFGWGNVMF